MSVLFGVEVTLSQEDDDGLPAGPLAAAAASESGGALASGGTLPKAEAAAGPGDASEAKPGGVSRPWVRKRTAAPPSDPLWVGASPTHVAGS